jgi:hypothetical protein
MTAWHQALPSYLIARVPWRTRSKDCSDARFGTIRTHGLDDY